MNEWHDRRWVRAVVITRGCRITDAAVQTDTCKQAAVFPLKMHSCKTPLITGYNIAGMLTTLSRVTADTARRSFADGRFAQQIASLMYAFTKFLRVPFRGESPCVVRPSFKLETAVAEASEQNGALSGYTQLAQTLCKRR